MMKNLYRGEVFYLIASPLDHVEAYRYFEDGGLAVVDGKIVEAGPFEAMRYRYPDFPVTDYSGKLITPGVSRRGSFLFHGICTRYRSLFREGTGEERNYDLCRLCHGSSCFRNRIIFRGYGV